MTKSLSALRALFVDYYANPLNYLDLNNLEEYDTDRHGNIKYLVQGKSLEQLAGLEKLGSGAYATVYALDERRVLKVIKRSDTGYARFVNDVVRKLGTANPFVPRVYYQGTWGKKVVYIMERLEETDANWNAFKGIEGWKPERELDYDERRRWKRHNRPAIEEIERAYAGRSAINRDFRSAIQNNLHSDFSNGNRFMRLDPKLEELCAALTESGCYGDLHSGNIMFRKDGTPVLTDPCAEG